MPQRTDPIESDYLTPREAASIASVSVRYLARLGDEGRIRVFRLPTSRHRRYVRADIESLLHEQLADTA